MMNIWNRATQSRVIRSIAAVVFLALILTPTSALTSPPAEETQQKQTVLFLVRHAEKTSTPGDPELTKEGKERAADLKSLLIDAGIEHVHSTNYLRTKSTASPTADALGLEVKHYSPRDLPAMASSLKKIGGRHLVVGHSNTTPSLVHHLGGEPGEAINEKNEYDRLYMLTLDRDGTVSTVVLRYGNPSPRDSKK